MKRLSDNPAAQWFRSLGDEQKLLFLMIALGLGVRIANIVTASAIDMDGVEFAGVARDLLRGSLKDALTSSRLPVFPAIMASFSLLVPDLELAGRLTSLVFGLLLIVLCFFFVKGLWGKEKALWASSLIAIHPFLAEYSGRVLAESVATLLFTGCLFSFYKGWTGPSSRPLTLAGFLLALAYLTKPEYILYFVPLSLILIFSGGGKDNPVANRVRLLLSFHAFSLLIVVSFLVYLRIHTGYWVIDRRVLGWKGGGEAGIMAYFLQAISTPAILGRIPLVLLNFCKAIYLPFLALAILGFSRACVPLRVLAIAVITFHILGRSFPTCTTSRYSLAFAPLVIVFSTLGVDTVKGYLVRFRKKEQMLILLMLVISVVSLFGGIRMPNHGREMQKEAGLLLRGYGRETNIAARLPITSYYAGGAWTDLAKILRNEDTCSALTEAIDSAKVHFVVIDEKVEKSHPFVVACVAKYQFFSRLGDAGEHVTIYRVRP